MSGIPTWLILPYWMIILFAIINIVTILLESSTKKEIEIGKQGNKTVDDVKSRDRLSAIPRIYLIIIYSVFFVYDTTLDTRAFWGRWGIFSILFIDSYCHFANYIDYHWYTIIKILIKIKQLIVLKIFSIKNSLSLLSLKFYQKIKQFVGKIKKWHK